ncbi:MAG: hypothetical protein M5U01_21310 [Ardenticatenaceae bacterium]|nr:hypothetical protein [Ardenticatenaceae bacterium]HBY97487.1 cytochrome C [Chloroflexota bacterium]
MTTLPLKAKTRAESKFQFQMTASSVLLWVAAALLLASIVLPYWKLTLNAPQYPGGLHVHVFANKMIGDIHEIDGLNHYIGMRRLDEAAKFEREISVFAIVALALLVLAVSFIHSKWAILLALPALSFPFVFLADLWFWLRYYGQNLDPHAPLSSAIKPFTPTVLGTGKIGQFSTTAFVTYGFYLALLAGVLIIAAFVIRQRELRRVDA